MRASDRITADPESVERGLVGLVLNLDLGPLGPLLPKD
jgi:hypothetical protein